MEGDTGLPIPGDRAGGSITDGEGSVLPCSCQLSCITLKVLQVQVRHIGYVHHGCPSSGRHGTVSEACVIGRNGEGRVVVVGVSTQ